MTTRYVLVPYVKVPADEIDDLETFDTYEEADRQRELQSFRQCGDHEVIHRVEEIEVDEG